MDGCKYCGSENLFTQPKPPHLGLYCKDCGRFQKWVKQEHYIADTEKPASEKQQSYALSLLTKWKHKGASMTARQAGAIIQAFKE